MADGMTHLTEMIERLARTEGPAAIAGALQAMVMAGYTAIIMAADGMRDVAEALKEAAACAQESDPEAASLFYQRADVFEGLNVRIQQLVEQSIEIVGDEPRAEPTVSGKDAAGDPREYWRCKECGCYQWMIDAQEGDPSGSILRSTVECHRCGSGYRLDEDGLPLDADSERWNPVAVSDDDIDPQWRGKYDRR